MREKESQAHFCYVMMQAHLSLLLYQMQELIVVVNLTLLHVLLDPLLLLLLLLYQVHVKQMIDVLSLVDWCGSLLFQVFREESAR